MAELVSTASSTTPTFPDVTSSPAPQQGKWSRQLRRDKNAARVADAMSTGSVSGTGRYQGGSGGKKTDKLENADVSSHRTRGLVSKLISSRLSAAEKQALKRFIGETGIGEDEHHLLKHSSERVAGWFARRAWTKVWQLFIHEPVEDFAIAFFTIGSVVAAPAAIALYFVRIVGGNLLGGVTKIEYQKFYVPLVPPLGVIEAPYRTFKLLLVSLLAGFWLGLIFIIVWAISDPISFAISGPGAFLLDLINPLKLNSGPTFNDFGGGASGGAGGGGDF